MKSCVWVLNIGNYRPDITKYTLPRIQFYAAKIGAEYREITERKFKDFPITYEKMQIWELGADYDYNILIDADVLISKDTCNIIKTANPAVIGTHGAYDISLTVKEPDIYFVRDGRQIGIATYFVMTSYMTHDFWEPLTMNLSEALSKMKREFVIDEYCVSRNLAKYGLKYNGLLKNINQINHLSLTTENNDSSESTIKAWIERDNAGEFK